MRREETRALSEIFSAHHPAREEFQGSRFGTQADFFKNGLEDVDEVVADALFFEVDF